MVENYFHPTILKSSLFHFLLYAAKGLSSLIHCGRRTILNRNSNLARINLTHMLGAPSSHSQATFGFSFRFMDRFTLPDYRALTSSLIAVVLQYKITPYLYERVEGMSTCRADWLLGLPRTIFTACG